MHQTLAMVLFRQPLHTTHVQVYQDDGVGDGSWKALAVHAQRSVLALLDTVAQNFGHLDSAQQENMALVPLLLVVVLSPVLLA